jgi:hypothetical protein
MSLPRDEKRQWVPEICYEDYEDAQLTNGLPFIQIPENKEMPNCLFFFGSTHTGEFQPGLDGEPEPIVEMELYQFACMKYLQDGLSTEDYDKVRACLGLMPVEEARVKGMKAAAQQAEDIQEAAKKNKI